MPAAILDKPLLIEQGATWDFAMVWKTDIGEPIDLTGCDARMQFRRSYGYSVLMDLGTATNTLVVDGPNGGISAQVSAEITSLIKEPSGVFDLEVYHPDGRVDRVLQGRWILSPEVTR